MCQIYTFVPGQLTSALTAVRSGLLGNKDGVNVLVVHKTRVVLSLSGLWSNTLLSLVECLSPDSWTRMFVHTRSATGGNITTGNCHGWADRDRGTRYVMHNGFISRMGREAFAVDSQAILAWIEDGDIRGALRKLGHEVFANVFLIDEGRGDYAMHRSSTGMLYTDGAGNYGTAPFGEVRNSVPAYTQVMHALETGAETSRKTLETPVTRTYGSGYGTAGSGAGGWSGEYGEKYWSAGSRSGGSGGKTPGKPGRGKGANKQVASGRGTDTTTEILLPTPPDGGSATTVPPDHTSPTRPPVLASADVVLHVGTDGTHYADDELWSETGDSRWKRWKHDGSGWVYLGVIDESGEYVRD